MRARSLFLIGIVVLSLWSLPALAQSEDLDALRREIEALKEEQRLIRKELQDIGNLLRGMRRPAAREPRDVVFEIGRAPVKGDPSATIALVEFSDYQCPFCARHARATLPQIQREYIATGKVKYVFRDFPIEAIHGNAFKAAGAAHCAGEQGKYWEMHDRLFANQATLSPPQLLLHAQALGLEPQAFRQCLDSEKYAAEIRTDLQEGQKAGVRGTPTFFLGVTDANDSRIRAVKMIVGAQPYSSFKEAIEALLAQPR